MRIADAIRRRLLRFAEGVMASRPPDLVIGPDQMRRWHVMRNKLFSIYVHYIRENDNDEALHDHRIVTLSLILNNAYREEMHIRGLPKHDSNGQRISMIVERKEGDIVFRLPTTPHALLLGYERHPVTTLFITGPTVRKWGFWCSKGWKPWDQYNTSGSYGNRAGRDPKHNVGC